MSRIALIGSKEFAQQIRSSIDAIGTDEVVGYFDDYMVAGSIVEGLPILGSTKDIWKIYNNQFFDSLFIAVGYSSFDFRERMFDEFHGRIPFSNIISRSANIDPSVIIGEGVHIGPDSSIGPHSIIADNVFIHGVSSIGHDNMIGRHTYISGRFDSAGFVQIGARNFIGIRVMFSDHISICDDVWIGLGCVVAKNIKEPGKYMSPAAKIYKIE